MGVVGRYRKSLVSFCCSSSSLCFSWKGKKVGLMNQNDIGRQHNQTYNFRMLVLLLLCARVFVCEERQKIVFVYARVWVQKNEKEKERVQE